MASKGNRAPICYRLDLIENLETTTQAFTRKDGWNLKEWSEQSFGVCMALQYDVSIYRDIDHLTIIGASKLGSNHDLISEFIKRANSLN